MMNPAIPCQAIGDQNAIVQIKQTERINYAQKAVCTLLQSGARSGASRSVYGNVLSTAIAGIVSGAYTSCIPVFVCYSSVPALGKVPLGMIQVLAAIGFENYYFFFAREGFQKLWNAIEALVTSRRCFEAKTITKEILISLWALLAASGAIFGVIYVKSDPANQGLPLLPAGFLAASAAMIAIPREMARARDFLANLTLMIDDVNADQRRRHRNIFRLIHSLDNALDFWRSSSSEFRESIYNSFMPPEFSTTDFQADLLCAIVQKTPSVIDIDMALPRLILRLIGNGAASVINVLSITGLGFYFSLLQTLALSSIFLGPDKAMQLALLVFPKYLPEDHTSVGNFTAEPLIDMPMSAVFTVPPDTLGALMFAIPLAIISHMTVILWCGSKTLSYWNTSGIGGQLSLLFQGNPLNFRHNEVFALSPLFFFARSLTALTFALGAGALYEGLNLMLIPVAKPEIHWVTALRAISAWYVIGEIFDFSCDWIDSSYRFVLRHAGSPAQKAYIAGVDVLNKLKSVLTNSSKNLDESALAELSDCWYDAPEDAPWLNNTSSTSLNDSAYGGEVGYYGDDSSYRDDNSYGNDSAYGESNGSEYSLISIPM